MSSHRYSTRSSGLPPASPTPRASRRSRKTPSSASRPPAAVVSVSASAASAEYSSDEFEFDDEQEVASVAAPSLSSTLSVGSSSSKREELPLVVQKTVLQDIELKGGIHLPNLRLQNILDNPDRSDIYGTERGSRIRIRIGKWVDKAKDWPKEKYIDKCRQLGVCPAEITYTSIRSSKKKPSKASKTTSKQLSSPTPAATSTPISEIRPTNLSFNQYRDPTPLIQFHDKKEANMASGEFI